jgi:ABC-2 type transport system ATP-binding protein
MGVGRQSVRQCDSLLRVEDVHKSYEDVRALAGVDLEVAAGEIVALLGPNGAGKTTLISIVAGLLRSDRGSVRIEGTDVAQRSHGASWLGLAPQETGIYPTVSVRDNLTFFGELVGLRRRELRSEIEKVAEAFDLVRLLERPAQSLSGGEARRLHTAMIVLGRPPLLLLDEPTTGVDVATRKMLLEVVEELARDGSAVCYSTHYLHEVEQLDADRVAILLDGKIAASGSMGDLIRAHGGASVELHFVDEPPALDLPGVLVQVEEHVLRISVEDSPATQAAGVLGRLGASASALREIKLIQPSLESVFLAITNGDAGVSR